MEVLRAPIRECGEYEALKKNMMKAEGPVCVIGCIDSQKPNVVDALGSDFDVRFVLTYSDRKAKELLEDLRLYDPEVVYYPARDLIFYQADIHGNELARERVRILRRILEGRSTTVVTTFDGMMECKQPLEAWKRGIFALQVGSTCEERAIALLLTNAGYEKTATVEQPGQFAMHGGILDIYDLTSDNPVRVELWGDTIESMRSFDVETQRSIEKIEEAVFYPVTELYLGSDELREGIRLIEKDGEKQAGVLTKADAFEEAGRIRKSVRELKERLEFSRNMVNLDSYLYYFSRETETLTDYAAGRSICFFLDEPNRIAEHADAVALEFRESMSARLKGGYVLPGQTKLLLTPAQATARITAHPTAGLAMMDAARFYEPYVGSYSLTVRSIASFNSNFNVLLSDLAKYKKEGYRVLLLSGSRSRAQRLAEDLRDGGILAFYTENGDRLIMPSEVMVFYGHVSRGFEYPLLKYAVISETDIFGKRKEQKKKKPVSGRTIRDFADLKVGDYVVHENHGLGIYRGIEKAEVNKVIKDFMLIEYAGGGKLYVLATALDSVQKYASADTEKVPKLSNLGTTQWTKTKSRVKQSVELVARDLVELYAARREKEGYVFSRDTVWQKEFEELFPYEETQDQLLAIEATKADMESHKIMDRLICGDVGYGKTEIAIRAAFKAVQDGKQVAYLVPTTILAQQHYNTFVQRMKDYPVEVEMVSRFRSTAQNKKTIEGLKSGRVDIAIGTHRLLSQDVSFKDLGLLIIDEEQRFGVTHKEKIKKMKESVDVLTLTATPIPRTLHMSLVGVRDMSLLEEAPRERVPIQTYVMEYNEELVREAIVRELSRDGQVYYVYNRVQNIAEVAAGIRELVPEAEVAFAHGQMSERELEEIMRRFIEGEVNVLVTTTIIETGLDISNVNTIIIHNSDRMGLAQLYQLRGRVGRSNRTAYAFLMYQKDKVLAEVAEKRLEAIREFTDLGSGFKIAMKDLEIRGAGTMLGTVQHGHMEAVGYDLYCKMLNEAVRMLKDENAVEDFNTYIDLDTDAYLPADYIRSEGQKMDIYKRIAGIASRRDCDDMKDEMIDRFGPLPQSAENLLRIALLRAHAHKLFVTELRGSAGDIRITMLPTAPVLVQQIPPLLADYSGTLRFVRGKAPGFSYRFKKYDVVEKDSKMLLERSERLLKDLERLFE